MIGSGAYSFLRFGYNFTLKQAIHKHFRSEDIIEPHMWIPCRKRVALYIRLQRAKTISVTGIQHQLNRLALQLATANLNQCANPGRQPVQLQDLSRRERVEVSD